MKHNERTCRHFWKVKLLQNDPTEWKHNEHTCRHFSRCALSSGSSCQYDFFHFLRFFSQIWNETSIGARKSLHRNPFSWNFATETLVLFFKEVMGVVRNIVVWFSVVLFNNQTLSFSFKKKLEHSKL